MKTLLRNAGPEVDALIEQIKADELNFSAELRSTDREPIVMPIHMASLDDDFHLSAFSRNISENGICLIAGQPFRPETNFLISFFSKQHPGSNLAQCRWSCKFGTSYWISGWKLDAKIQLGKLLKENDSLQASGGSSNIDQKIAIPLSVHREGDSPKVSGFTRSVSRRGVSLLTELSVTEGSSGILELMRLNGDSAGVVARCVWARPYGTDHWLSEWEFPEHGGA
jgi:hypothetical protein